MTSSSTRCCQGCPLCDTMSLLGIGTDVVHIERIASTLAKHSQRFLDRAFHASEQAAFHAKRKTNEANAIAYLAGRCEAVVHNAMV